MGEADRTRSIRKAIALWARLDIVAALLFSCLLLAWITLH